MEIIPFDHLSRSFHAPVLQSMTELYEHGTHDPVRVQGAAVAALRTLIAAAARAGGSFGAASGLLALDDEALAARWGAVPAMGRPAVEARRAEPSLYGEAAFKTYLERTSGTTGSPFRVVRSSHSLQREFLRMRYVLRYFATRLAVALPSRIVYLSDYPAAQSYQYLDTTDWPVFVYKITCRTPVELAEGMTKIPSRSTFVAAATPSTFARLLSGEASARAVDFLSGAAFLMSSGEHLPEELREKIRAIVKRPVLEIYVMREFGVIGFECQHCGGFHVFHNDLYVSAGPSGQIRISDATNYSDIYLNYDTGDVAELEQVRSFDCGQAFPLLKNLSGRAFGKPYSSATV